MTLQEAYNRADFCDPFFYTGNASLTSNTNTQTIKLEVGNIPILVQTIEFSVMDSLGKLYDTANSNAQNLITVQIKDETGVTWFSNDSSIYNVMAMTKHPNFRGYIFEANKTYTITLTAAGFPATVISSSMPVRVDCQFGGPKIK